uniref:Transmembrane protein 198 n=1 Tax=Strigamia maritima TaxID=126957 RepID=T1J8G7_STRMM
MEDLLTTAVVNSSSDEDERCKYVDYNYDIIISIICGMYLIFGVVYSLFGYRCFKAIMFLTGFIFGSVVVYLICLEENLLSSLGNAGVALGAGVLFGLITMLVQYVGLFMTGFHLGILLGVVTVAVLHHLQMINTVWITAGTLIGSGLVFAVATLYWQKGLTIIGTSVYGGAIIAASMDYFIEKFIMLYWIWDRLRVADWSPTPCWFSWLILAVWPFMIVLGTITQFRITGRGIYHQELLPTKKSRQVNLNRIRKQECRADVRQKRYRYLYQVRTAHGDIISQSLQKKAWPTSSDGTMTIRSDEATLRTTASLNPSESTTTTMSQKKGIVRTGVACFEKPKWRLFDESRRVKQNLNIDSVVKTKCTCILIEKKQSKSVVHSQSLSNVRKGYVRLHEFQQILA